MLITGKMLVDAGISTSSLVGRKIARIDPRNSRRGIIEVVKRSADRIHIETSTDYYHVKDIYVMEIKKEELQAILDNLEEIKKSVYQKLKYLKDSKQKQYDEVDVTVIKTLNAVKKNKIKEAKEKIEDLLFSFFQ